MRFTIRDEEQEVASFAPGGNLFWNVNSNVAEDTFTAAPWKVMIKGLVFEVGLSGIAADEKNELLYRAIFDDGSLRESRFDGSESRVILSGLSGPVAIDVDAANGKIYWADFVANVIARANLDGSGFEVIAAGQANGGKANLADVAAGPAAQRSAPDAQALAQPWGLAIDHSNAKIYWTEQSGNRVARANLDGSAEETLFALKDSLDGPRGIVVDPGWVSCSLSIASMEKSDKPISMVAASKRSTSSKPMKTRFRSPLIAWRASSIGRPTALTWSNG